MSDMPLESPLILRNTNETRLCSYTVSIKLKQFIRHHIQG